MPLANRCGTRAKDDEEHQQKAKLVVDTVFEAIDKDKDGKITLEEFEAVGLDALPSFENLGAEGHHYDVESGAYTQLPYYLLFPYDCSNNRVFPPPRRYVPYEGSRHPSNLSQPNNPNYLEQYHGTPETQEASAYVHPEDIEHFSHHEFIEREEAEREAVFQGISVEEAIAQHAEPPPGSDDQHPPDEGAKVDEQEVPKKFERQTPLEQQDPALRFSRAKSESAAHGDWGSGEAGYKPPTTPGERMRKNLPYKVM